MKRALIVFIVFIVLSYGLFEARKLLEGPEITIQSPADGSATSTTAVTVVGTAQNISFLTINDAPSYTDEAGGIVFSFSPAAGPAPSTTGVRVVGTLQNISFLTINAAPPSTDGAGRFVYRFSPPAGY